MTETADQIAARWGATVAPGVVVQRIARGVSARPLPVWDAGKNCLVVPDWKEERERAKLATLRSAGRARKGQRDPAVVDRQARVRAMQARGLTLDAMMAESGLREDTLKADLRAMGLGWTRDPAAVADRRRAGRRVREAVKQALIGKMVAEGADDAAIAAATGIEDLRWLRELIRRVKPDFVFTVKLPPSPARDRTVPRPPTAAQRAVAPQIAAWLAEGVSYIEMGKRLGKTRGAVSGLVFRLRVNGLLPGAAERLVA